jgi:trypsin
MVTVISSVAVLAFVILGINAAPKVSINGRIVGGDLTDISVLPYQVSLQIQQGNQYYHICGGSIIDAKYVVTAAHCTQTPNSKMQVRVGSSVNSAGGRVYQVKRIISHEHYNEDTIDYDISLLELVEPIVFNDKTSIVGLAEQDDCFEADEEAVVSGWGDTLNFGDDLRLLRSATVPIFDQELCAVLYQNYGGVTDRMICAGYLAGGKDSCQVYSKICLKKFGFENFKIYYFYAG